MASIKNHWSKIALVIIILLHLITFRGAIQSDGTLEMALAQSFLDKGCFELYGEPRTHFPPVIPLAILPFLVIFGFNAFAIHLAQFFYFIVSLYIFYNLAKLFSQQSALKLTVIYAIDPIIFGSMYGGTSEVVLSILIMISVYCALKGRDRPYYLVASGVFLALAYLSKASSLHLALGAALYAGVVFYILQHRYKVHIIDKRHLPYIATAITIFFMVIGLWSVRNYLRYGSYETNEYTSDAIGTLASAPLLTIREILIYAVVYMLWALIFVLPIVLLIVKSLKQSRVFWYKILSQNDIIILFLFISAIYIFAIVAGSALILYEPELYINEYFSPQHIRYFAIADPLILIGVYAVATKCYHDNYKNGLNLNTRKIFAPIFVIVIVLNIPFLIAQESFIEEYNKMRYYIDYNDIEEVWSDSPHDIKYNIPGLTVNYYRNLYDVPDNATVISTVAVDTDSVRFWRFVITPRYHPPVPVSKIEVVILTSNQSRYANLRIQWTHVKENDLAGYNIYWDTVWHEKCISYRYGFHVSSTTTTYDILNLPKGNTYYICVVAVDRYGNLRVRDYSWVKIKL